MRTDARSGYANGKAGKRLEVHGANELVEGEQRSPWLMLAGQFTDFMIVVLLVAAVVAGVVGEPQDSIAIVVIVVLNAVIGFVQEYRAERTMAALRRLGAPHARVVRDGRIADIPARELVPGDLVLLEAGNIVPADLRLVEAVRLKVQEAALTGESLPVDKQVSPVVSGDAALGDAMQRALEVARQAAPTNAAVLLRGESGTGKTVLARAIHGWSRRSGKPFGVVSCPALPAELLTSELFGHVKGAFTGAVRDNPGRIATCEGGTLFLDEIGDLPLSLQPKLLRFLQDQEYERLGDPLTRKADVRIITATNRVLEDEVKAGRFREDLYYRLNVIQIEIPPFRERLQDLEALAAQLLAFYGKTHHRTFTGFTEEAMQVMRRHSWPGNLRELRNVIERASILCQTDRIGVEHLPGTFSRIGATPALGNMVSLEKIEEEHIRGVLPASKSLQEAAEILGIDQATLWRRRKQ